MSVGREPQTEQPNDRVRIRLGKNEDVRTVETYTFHSSIFQQPAAFALHISAGQESVADVVRKYPPGPHGRCALYIGDFRQFTGELDAVNATGDASKTTLELRGRDLMARLHDQDIVGERSFKNATYEELFKAALADVGQKDKIVEISNLANVRVKSGTGVRAFSQPVSASEVKQSSSGNNRFGTQVTAKMGESWLTFLNRHFGKLGLFAWCDADGNFVLSRPNGDQEAMFHFFRRRGQAASISNVKAFSFTNDTTHRFSELVVFARNQGRKAGHNHTNGGFKDKDMLALGFERRRVYRDHDVTSQQEAEFYARRTLAECNRAGWKLRYTISGHSAPLIKEIDKRGIVVPDMIARVDDDDLDIHENLYIESVEYTSPPRQTVITMMRPQDLVFGENQAKAAEKKAEARAQQQTQKREEAVRQPISFKRDPTHRSNTHRAAVSSVNRPARPEPPPRRLIEPNKF